MLNLIADYIVNADGTGSAIFFFDGIEISEAEYWNIQIAAIARSIEEG